MPRQTAPQSGVHAALALRRAAPRRELGLARPMSRPRQITPYRAKFYGILELGCVDLNLRGKKIL